jgi:hypothetical protein
MDAATAVLGPAPGSPAEAIWALFWVLAAALLALLGLLVWLVRSTTRIRQRDTQLQEWARGCEERARQEVQRRDALRRAARVDGWLEPARELSPRPAGQGRLAVADPDGWQLSGRVTNRGAAPVWDVLVEAIDPQTRRALPLPTLYRSVLPPGQEWPLVWTCGSAFAPAAPGTGRPAGPREQLPVPSLLIEAGSSRPQLRITFSDDAGRWVRVGASVAAAPSEWRLPPGSAAFGRAVEEVEAARAPDAVLDCARVGAEVAQALRELARHRLGPSCGRRIELGALPSLLADPALAGAVYLDPAAAMSPAVDAPGRLAAMLSGAFAELELRARATPDEFAGADDEADQQARRRWARLLLAQAGSVLTLTAAVRISAGARTGQVPVAS